MPRATQGVKTAAMSVAGCASEIAGRLFMPRERQVSPSGAQIATVARIKYWRGDKVW